MSENRKDRQAVSPEYTEVRDAEGFLVKHDEDGDLIKVDDNGNVVDIWDSEANAWASQA